MIGIPRVTWPCSTSLLQADTVQQCHDTLIVTDPSYQHRYTCLPACLCSCHGDEHVDQHVREAHPPPGAGAVSHA
jgi:hypothetical protein